MRGTPEDKAETARWEEEMVWSDARRQWAELLAGPPPSPQVRALHDAGRRGYEQAAADFGAEIAQLRAEVERLRAESTAWNFAEQAVIDRAREWREMRRGKPTRPKPEAAALIVAVDEYEALPARLAEGQR